MLLNLRLECCFRTALVFFLSFSFFQLFALEAAPRTDFVAGLATRPSTFDPRQNANLASPLLHELIHCALIRYDSKGKLENGIVQKTPHWSDPKTLELKLQTGLHFSDGSPLTSADVAATLQSFLGDVRHQDSTDFTSIQDIQIIDQLTFRIRLKFVDASFMHRLTFGLLPKRQAEANTFDLLKTPLCGPYVVKLFNNELIELHPNPFRTNEKSLQLNRLIFKFLPDQAQLLAELKSGKLDLVQGGLTYENLRDIEKHSPIHAILRQPSINTSMLGFNLQDPILSDRRIRNAIAQAIDRPKLISFVLNGMAKLATGLLSPSSPFFDRNIVPIVYDPLRAQLELDKAGYPKKIGPRLKLTLATSNDPGQITIARSIAVQLARVGIELEIQAIEGSMLNKHLTKGQAQLWLDSGMTIRDPDSFRLLFSSTSALPQSLNYGRYRNTVLDNLLAKALETVDLGERFILYSKIQRIIASDIPCLFLWHLDNFAVKKTSLQGFSLSFDQSYRSILNGFFR